MNFWMVVLLISIILVGADKMITYVNVKQVEKNFNVDPTSVEKNPLARVAFQKLGVGLGTFAYFLLSVPTFLVAVYFINLTLDSLVTNSRGISLYIVMMLYGLVLMNNFYFFLKFSRVIQ